VTSFVRYQSAVPNRCGRHPGVFALATVDPTCYDRERNPGARAWFKETATNC
jgi:hypothetical protein